MQSRYEDFQTLKTDILAVSTDPPEDSLKIVKKLDLSFPILSDPDLKVIDQFGLRHEGGMMGSDIARPAVYLLNGEGKIVWQELTDNWRVRVRPSTIIDVIGEKLGASP